MFRSAFLALQPIQRVQQFAEFLGWRDVKVEAFAWPESADGFLVLYATTDERFNLQISRRHDLGPDHYVAAVVAERYGITSVPHQPFQLFDDLELLQAEARRLFPLVGRANFKHPAWRRQFAEQYPIRIMMRYRQRNKFLNQQRDRAVQIAAGMRSRGLNPYDYRP